MQEETAQEYKHTRGLESPKVTLEPGHPPLMPLVFQSVSSYRGPRSTVLSGLPAITQSFLYRNLVQLSYPPFHAFDAIFPEEPCLNLLPDTSGASPAGTWYPPTSQNFS